MMKRNIFNNEELEVIHEAVENHVNNEIVESCDDCRYIQNVGNKIMMMKGRNIFSEPELEVIWDAMEEHVTTLKLVANPEEGPSNVKTIERNVRIANERLKIAGRILERIQKK